MRIFKYIFRRKKHYIECGKWQGVCVCDSGKQPEKFPPDDAKTGSERTKGEEKRPRDEILPQSHADADIFRA